MSTYLVVQHKKTLSTAILTYETDKPLTSTVKMLRRDYHILLAVRGKKISTRSLTRVK